MTQAIWKYPLRIVGEQEIRMPAGPKALAVQFQGDVLTLWVMVWPKEEVTTHKVWIVGTGHDFSRLGSEWYVGTVQEQGGALVWHVFFS